MKYKTTLFVALASAGVTVVNGFEVDQIHTTMARGLMPGQQRLDLSDGETFLFVEDQQIEVNDGDSSFVDFHGHNHAISFMVAVSMEERHLIKEQESAHG
jgi:hypothetical protein